MNDEKQKAISDLYEVFRLENEGGRKMDTFVALLNALGPFAWPMVILIFGLRFGHLIPGIGAVGATKISIGGNEISIEKAISNLGKTVSELTVETSKVLPVETSAVLPMSAEAVSMGAQAVPSAVFEDTATEKAEAETIRNDPSPVLQETDGPQRTEKLKYQKKQMTNPKAYLTSILWVDDHPENNYSLVEVLKDRGIFVTTATSTKEALQKLKNQEYDAIISDMGRQEGRVNNSSAGVELAKSVRSLNRTIPLFIFCSSEAKRKHASAAAEAGATNITASPTNLLRMLRGVGFDIE